MFVDYLFDLREKTGSVKGMKTSLRLICLSEQNADSGIQAFSLVVSVMRSQPIDTKVIHTYDVDLVDGTRAGGPRK